MITLTYLYKNDCQIFYIFKNSLKFGIYLHLQHFSSHTGHMASVLCYTCPMAVLFYGLELSIVSGTL